LPLLAEKSFTTKYTKGTKKAKPPWTVRLRQQDLEAHICSWFAFVFFVSFVVKPFF